MRREGRELTVGKILVIGVTCVDVVVNLDRLPRTAEDVLVRGQKMTLGGCAFNAFWVMHAMGEPSILFSPVGTGAYGDFVRASLAAEGIVSPIDDAPADNGCCYCFVEDGGERTFASYHGAEYLYQREWFDRIDMDEIDSVYVCGLEIEEPTGPNVVDFLERRCVGKRIFFTPGPRPAHVPIDLLERIYDLHPILHLNDTEAVLSASRLVGRRLPGDAGAASWSYGGFVDGGVQASAHTLAEARASRALVGSFDPRDSRSGTASAEVVSAARELRSRTGNLVLVTLGRKGCYYDSAFACGVVSEAPLEQRVDTIGAGDAHIGATMACLHRGDSVPEALACANRVAAAVVGTSGAHPAAVVIRQAAEESCLCAVGA